VLRELVERRSISQDTAGKYFISHHQVSAALEQLQMDAPAQAGRATKSPVRRARGASKAKKATASKSPAKQSTGKGPSAAVNKLVESGFFNEPRTLRDVQDRLKRKSGMNVDLPRLSPILLHLLRKGLLDRDQNKDGTYEYIKD
jgi:hypothetical protein